MFVANLSGAGDPFIWNIFNPESRGCHPMIFFLVHFRRYRKPVKNRYSSIVGESYSKIQNKWYCYLYLPEHLYWCSSLPSPWGVCHEGSPDYLLYWVSADSSMLPGPERETRKTFMVLICGNFDNIIYSSSNIHLSYCLLKQNLNLSEALPNHLDTKHPGKIRELYPNKPRYEIVVLKT